MQCETAGYFPKINAMIVERFDTWHCFLYGTLGYWIFIEPSQLDLLATSLCQRTVKVHS